MLTKFIKGYGTQKDTHWKTKYRKCVTYGDGWRRLIETSRLLSGTNFHPPIEDEKMAITGIQSVTMPVDKAKILHAEYVELAKKNATQHVMDMKAATWQLSQGNEMIDIYQTFKRVALEDDMPKLAIVRADAERCHFEKRSNGAGCFGQMRIESHWKVGKIALPTGTYAWQQAHVRMVENTWGGGTRKTYRATTVPPTIPAAVYPKHALHNYFILWEVEKGGWLPDPIPPGDPYLLKRVTKNLFVPLASWDLTPLEKSILSGVAGPSE